MSDPEREDGQTVRGPILVLIRGLPGSGKTYLAETLRTKLGEDQVVMLDPDAVDYNGEVYREHTVQLTEEGVEEKFHPYRFLRSRAHQGIADRKIIIWNQPFTLAGGFERTIENLRSVAAEQGVELPILAVEITIDPKTAHERVAQRKAQGGHGPSDGRFAKYVDEYVTFVGKGQDHTITLQGKDDIATSATAVLQALQEIQK